MLVLHHLENSRSHRIVWLLEELGVSYEIKVYQRDSQSGLAPAELEAVHALGKAPVITDDGTTIAESGAIVEYLVDAYDDGKLRPLPDSPERMAYTYWLHYAEGTFMPLMIVALLMGRIEQARVPFFVKPVAKGIVKKVREGYLDPNLTRNLGFMETTLERQEWFAGDNFSAADVHMSFCLEAAEARTNLRADYPALGRSLDRMRARPAYQRALERGGPLELLGGLAKRS